MKEALLDISTKGDQVFINTHSSVLVADDPGVQNTYLIKKDVDRTTLNSIQTPLQRQNLIYDLLGGSPKDLLLPSNFLIVEGQSEYVFLSLVIDRFYKEEFSSIRIIFARGDMDRASVVMHRIHDAYVPLIGSIYEDKIVVITDKPNENGEKGLKTFRECYPNCNEENDRLFILPEYCLEDYYPQKWKKACNDESLRIAKVKVQYAEKVGSEISKKQFEEEMIEFFKALCSVKEKGF